MSYDEPYTFASYYEGMDAFKNGETVNPYPQGDEQHGPWSDGWYDAFDKSVS